MLSTAALWSDIENLISLGQGFICTALLGIKPFLFITIIYFSGIIQ